MPARSARRLILLFLLPAACGSESAEPPVPKPAAPPEAPVTEEECLAAAREIEASITKGDIAPFRRLFDRQALLDTALRDLEASPQATAGFSSAIDPTEQIGGQVIGLVKKGATYTLLRVHDAKDGKRALFRLILPEEGGFNYHDYVFERRKGKVRIVDVHVFLSGELFSRTIRRGFMPLAAQKSRSFLSKLAGWESEYVKHFPTVSKMVAALQSGSHAEVLHLYKKLPAPVQRDKNVLVIRFRAAQQLDERRYLEALEDFRKYHPDDASVDAMSVDLHLLKMEFPEARKCIDRIEEMVGGDPNLNVLRANVYVQEKNLDAARTCARQALKDEPDLLGAYWSLVGIGLEDKDYKEIARLLTEMAEKQGVIFNDLTVIPEYAGFVKSPEYKAWIEAQKK